MWKTFQIPSAQTIIQHFKLDPQSVGQDVVAWLDLASEEVVEEAKYRQFCVQLACEGLNTKSRRKWIQKSQQWTAQECYGKHSIYCET